MKKEEAQELLDEIWKINEEITSVCSHYQARAEEQTIMMRRLLTEYNLPAQQGRLPFDAEVVREIEFVAGMMNRIEEAISGFERPDPNDLVVVMTPEELAELDKSK